MVCHFILLYNIIVQFLASASYNQQNKHKAQNCHKESGLQAPSSHKLTNGPQHANQLHLTKEQVVRKYQDDEWQDRPIENMVRINNEWFVKYKDGTLERAFSDYTDQLYDSFPFESADDNRDELQEWLGDCCE